MVRGKVIERTCEEIEADPSLPIKRAYNRVVQDLSDDDVPEFYSIKSTIQRKRRALMPAIPRAVDDVNLRGEWSETWRGDQFLSLLDNNWGIAVFTTDENLRVLRQCSTVFIDGTFRSCPAPYTQFVTLHGLYFGRALPLVMCLMEGRQVGQYRQLLQHVKRQVRQVTGHRFRPRRFVCDFERAILLTIQTEVPTATVCACYFHFCQSIWRHVQQLGLHRAYHRRRAVKRLIRKIMAIGFVPLPLVRNSFRALCMLRSTIRIVRRYPAVADFLRYFRDTYMNGVYRPPIWNVYHRPNTCRTNNHVEGMLATST